ncbi:MAG: hypothetical protein Kow0080_21860 [Candidatus Promineifilaceae bacterium]
MTTKQRSRPNQQMGSLKSAIALGSLAATFLGTRLLALQAQEPAAAVAQDPIVITVPVSLPTNGQNVMNVNGRTATQLSDVSLGLPPIPQAITPQIQTAPPSTRGVAPITRTRSSK